MKIKDFRSILDNFEDNEEIEFSLVYGFGRRKLKICAAEPQEKGLYLELEEEIKMKMDINYGDLAKYLRSVKNKLFNISDMMSRDDFQITYIFESYLEDFIENHYNGMDLEMICQILESIDAAQKAEKPFEY